MSGFEYTNMSCSVFDELETFSVDYYSWNKNFIIYEKDEFMWKPFYFIYSTIVPGLFDIALMHQIWPENPGENFKWGMKENENK